MLDSKEFRAIQLTECNIDCYKSYRTTVRSTLN